MRERDETVYQLVLKINEIQPDQWDEVDERDYRLIDAALRRAKAEGWREAAQLARQMAAELTEMHEQSVRTDRLGYGCAALQDLANQLDARAAQIEEGE